MKRLFRHKKLATVVGVTVYSVLQVVAPYSRGKLAARFDIVRKHFELKIFGLPCRWNVPYGRLLMEKYGIHLNPVSGFVLTADVLSYVKGYNDRMRSYLIRKHGMDIFKDCERKARLEWESEKRDSENS